MTRDERNKVRRSAADNHKGNLEAAACEFLDASAEFKKAKGIPPGFEAAVGGIVDELEKHEKDDAEAEAQAATPTNGKTTAKSK